MNIDTLEGRELDKVVYALEDTDYQLLHYSPSTKWDQGGPIMEREGISVVQQDREPPEWSAFKNREHGVPTLTYGPTPLIAAMRCYIKSKLGVKRGGGGFEQEAFSVESVADAFAKKQVERGNRLQELIQSLKNGSPRSPHE